MRAMKALRVRHLDEFFDSTLGAALAIASLVLLLTIAAGALLW